jgi:hypothetical protein
MKRIPNTNLFLPDTTTPEVIDLDKLKAELATLKAQSAASEPTELELIDWARAMHPYYMDRHYFNSEIERLTKLITELEGL